jgi:NADH-quinone oxidoreductase subunit M
MAGPLSTKTIALWGHDVAFSQVAFIMLLLGFAVRIPAFPLHSWYVVAQSEAPVAIAVVLAALFLKTGAYGLLRVNFTLFPQAAQWMASSIAILGIINILYGALCALGQKDIRKLVAYMCISHMGFALLGLGIFSQTSFHGALLHLMCHGIYASLLVFLAGALGERAGHYNIVSDDNGKTFGGLVERIPVLSGFFTIGVFAAVGIPGLAGFPPESLVFLGTFPEKRVLTVLALCGLLLTAGYFLWMYRRVFLGPPTSSTAAMVDLTVREKIFLTPLAVVCVVAGLYPTPFMSLSAATLSQILGALK